MYKKIIIQFFLLILIFGIILFTFLYYFDKEQKPKAKVLQKIENSSTINQNSKINDEEIGTLIKDISYSFSDAKGNEYLLLSEYGKIDLNNPDKMLMTNVKATINLVNSFPIKITSKYANYNKINHETNFYFDVKLTHLMHKTISQNLDISFDKNIASMYNNIVYSKPGTELTADKLDIDLITKNSKIFMNNEYEKIKIIDNQ